MGTNIKRFDGSVYIPKYIQRYNGSIYVTPIIKRFDGSIFQAVQSPLLKTVLDANTDYNELINIYKSISNISSNETWSTCNSKRSLYYTINMPSSDNGDILWYSNSINMTDYGKLKIRILNLNMTANMGFAICVTTNGNGTGVVASAGPASGAIITAETIYTVDVTNITYSAYVAIYFSGKMGNSGQIHISEIWFE